MSYNTKFEGSLSLSRKVTEEENDYLYSFNTTPRYKRDVNKLMKLYHGDFGLPYKFQLTYLQKKQIEALENSGLEITYREKGDFRTAEQIYGLEGEYFILETLDESILDMDCPPGQSSNILDREVNKERIDSGYCQPSTWCNWEIASKSSLQWDGKDNFYYYISWLEYMIVNFFEPWEIKLNGEIKWYGEERTDMGLINVVDSFITIKRGKIIYE